MSIRLTRIKLNELTSKQWIAKGNIRKKGPDVVSYRFQETATGSQIPYLAARGLNAIFQKTHFSASWNQ